MSGRLNNIISFALGSPRPSGSSSSEVDAEPSTTPTSTLSSSSCIVHTLYGEADQVPPKPEPASAWTRFVCVSDTHSREFHVPNGDVLLHGGDLTDTGDPRGMQITVDWLRGLPHPKKIIIAGNHDLTLHQQDGWYAENFDRWHRTFEQVGPILELLKGQAAQDAGIVYLQDEKYEFQAKPGGRVWSVWGSPWSPEFYNWAFNYKRGARAEEIVNAIPRTDILITHGPPFEILDRTMSGAAVGCEVLRARLDSGSLRPRLHLFGHIHEAHGAILRPAPVPRKLGSIIGAQATAEAKSETSDSATSQESGYDTAFVNAANWPMGAQARDESGRRVEFGTGAFSAIVVDLLDEAA